MLIAILVLLGLAGAVWYFARKQTQTVTLSKGDVAASDPYLEAAVKTNERLEKMSKKIDETLTKAPESPSKKVKAEVAPKPLVEESHQILEPVVEAAPVVEVAPVVEAPKPAKKKRRYYPKKK